MLRFDGRVALITGAGRGMGREHALLLSSRGARVVVNDYGVAGDGTGDQSLAPADAVVDEIRGLGGEAIAEGSSVSTSVGGRAMVEAALDAWGRLDVVVHNAGIGVPEFELDEISDDELDRVIGTHLLGAFHVLRPAWTRMREQAFGRVVLISSATALGIPYSFDYAAAKGGLVSLARCLAVSGASSGITANAIMPVAWTRLAASAPGEQTRAWIETHFRADQVSPVVAWLSHEATTLTGETFSVGAGRVARVFYGTVPGYVNPGLTPEDLAGHADDVMDVADFVVARTAADDSALLRLD